MATPNIRATAGTINGVSAVAALSTTLTAAISNAAASGQVLKVESLYASNTHASNAVQVSVSLYRSSTDYYLTKSVSVSPQDTGVIIDSTAPVYLNEGDSLRVAMDASPAGTGYVIVNYLQIS